MVQGLAASPEPATVRLGGVLGACREAVTASISRLMRCHVRSHDMLCSRASTLSSRSLPSSHMAARTAATKASVVSAMCTNPCCPYGLTTSWIDVDTTDLPTAKYSGILVGLMKRVAALWANGKRATSQPER